MNSYSKYENESQVTKGSFFSYVYIGLKMVEHRLYVGSQLMV